MKTMSQLITWSESYKYGIEEIDRQHQMLMAMINELHNSMLAGKSKESLVDILDGLAKYTVYHFGTEEKYFEQYAYPGKDNHQKEHSGFAQKVRSFQGQFKRGEESLSLEVLNFLAVWLKDHISESDRKACVYLVMKGGG